MWMSSIVTVCLASLFIHIADGKKKKYKHELKIQVTARICLGEGTNVPYADDILEGYVIMLDGVSDRQVLDCDRTLKGAICINWLMYVTQAGPLKGVAIGFQQGGSARTGGTWILHSMTIQILGYLYDGTTHCKLENTVLHYRYRNNVRVACLSNYDHDAAVAQLHTTYPNAWIFTGCTDGWHRQKKC